MQPELLMISWNRGGAGLRTTSYAAGSAPVIAHKSAEPAIGREKRITVGQQLATYICLWLEIQYHAARHG
jgi:hypothetical protein